MIQVRAVTRAGPGQWSEGRNLGKDCRYTPNKSHNLYKSHNIIIIIVGCEDPVTTPPASNPMCVLIVTL